MSGPARQRLPDRRIERAVKMRWHVPSGAELGFHLRIGYTPGPGWPFGRPLELWLTPGRRASRYGGMLMWNTHDTAESLSLLLQHGHTLADLRARFKPGSLARCAVEWTWMESAEVRADVPPLPDDLAAMWRAVLAAEAAQPAGVLA